MVLACLHQRCTCWHSSPKVPPYSAQCGSASPDHLLFWNVYNVSCVFRQADIGSPIIGYTVVRKKLLFIGLLSGVRVHLALEKFLTCIVGRVIFVYISVYLSKAVEWLTQEREFLKYLYQYIIHVAWRIKICLPNVLACFETTPIFK